MLRRYAFLFLGVFACSTSVIWIRLSHTPPILIAAIRLLLAVVFLAPVFLRDLRAHRGAYTRAHFQRTWLPALALALHLMSWTFGARMTLAAQATLIVNLVPIAIPFFLHALVGEKINRAEILGTAIAVGSVVLLTAHDAFRGHIDGWGNLVCFGSLLLFAWYLALGRRNRDFPSLWLYVVPLYFQAGLICLVCSLPWLGSFPAASTREWSILIGMTLVPTVIGHSLLNLALRALRGQIVSLANVAQFVFATVMAFFLFGEHPTLSFYLASACVVAGIALVIFSAPDSSAPDRSSSPACD